VCDTDKLRPMCAVSCVPSVKGSSHQLSQPARKASWNIKGVEPGNQEGSGLIGPKAVLELIQNADFVRNNGTK